MSSKESNWETDDMNGKDWVNESDERMCDESWKEFDELTVNKSAEESCKVNVLEWVNETDEAKGIDLTSESDDMRDDDT
jgi:hypothetical protein